MRLDETVGIYVFEGHSIGIPEGGHSMARQTREGRRISDELLDELLAGDDPAEVFRSGRWMRRWTRIWSTSRRRATTVTGTTASAC